VKFADWDKRLTEVITGYESCEFVWGEKDCCMFAADVVSSITGTDYASEFRGKYTDEEGAAALLEEKGGLESVMDSKFKKHSNINMTMRGDVVCYETETGLALGICVGYTSMFMSPKGLIQIPTNKCLYGWEIK